MRDEALLALVRGGRARELQLYMSYQPCHHSGGRLPEDAARKRKVAAQRANQGHPTSCSVRLRDFCMRELRSHGTELVLVVADLYKVMWTAERMVERAPEAVVERSTYCADASSGLEGLRLLLAEAGISFRSMSATDWAFLIGLCDPSVQHAYAYAASPFTRVHTGLRSKLDAHISRFLESQKHAAMIADAQHRGLQQEQEEWPNEDICGAVG